MGFMFNEDNGHFFGTRGADGRKITKKDIIDWVMQYVDSNVDTLFISPNAMKTSYRSDVWDSIWDNVGVSDNDWVNKWSAGAKSLHEDGIDVYKVMTDTCRENNLECFLSMRMNDTHDVPNLDSPMHSRFWKEHHDYWRVKHKFTDYFCRDLDYSIKEVQDYHFSLVNELFERYDFDGFEMDWMRFPLHLKQGYELEGQEHITNFMRRVRKIADKYEIKRGHKIKISARIHSRPRTAFENGMDFLTWAREGLVDIIIPTPFWVSIDNDIPIELWKSILKNTDVEVVAGLEQCLARSRGKYILNSIETFRGSIIAYINRGADNIYIFNIMDKLKVEGETELTIHEEIIATSMTLDTLNAKSRRHSITNVDIVAPGAAEEKILPKTFGGWETFRINIGPIPPQDKKSFLILGTKEEMNSDLKVYFNGNVVEKADVKFDEFEIFGIQNVFSINNDLLKEGYNIFDINLKVEMELLWAEIYIK